ncbi:uncharacterized protein LOC143830546 [Paroedura picta]|uniref:uncharacterized protein LOC143830546 n=1 Tax=Paroedura picta TaxID=143630 RepID=UPI0040573216
MKVFVLGLLLVSLYCIEGAVVKREAEGEGQEPAPSEAESFIAQYFPMLAPYLKKDFVTQYADQTRALIQQFHERIFNEETTQRIGQALTTAIESAKRAIQ